MLAAVGLTTLMPTLLFGIGEHDPASFAATGLLLVIVSLAASLVPALLSTRVDPVIALRN